MTYMLRLCQSREKKPLLTFDCSNATHTCTDWQRPTQCLILKGLSHQMSSTFSGYIYIFLICKNSHEESSNVSSPLCNSANGHTDVSHFCQRGVLGSKPHQQDNHEPYLASAVRVCNFACRFSQKGVLASKPLQQDQQESSGASAARVCDLACGL